MANKVFVTLEVQMTPEDYIALKKAATWDYGDNVGKYMVDSALGRTPRGC